MVGKHRYSPAPLVWTIQDGAGPGRQPEEIDVATIPVPDNWLADAPVRGGPGRLALTDDALNRLVDGLAGRGDAALPEDLSPYGMVALLDAAWTDAQPWRELVETRLRQAGRSPSDFQQHLHRLQQGWDRTWMSRHGDTMAWLTDGITTDADLDRWEAAMDEGLYRAHLLDVNPGRLSVEELARTTLAAVRDREAAGRGPLSKETVDVVVQQLAARAAAAPTRPDLGEPQVDPAAVARATIEEYLLARGWEWPPERAGAWAMSRVWLKEPWLRGEVAPLLAAAGLLPSHRESDAEARAASTTSLLDWVDQARRASKRALETQQTTEREIDGARHAAASAMRHRDEKLLVLQGLQRELGEVGPWWRRGNRSRRAGLRARIAEQAQTVERLDAQVDRAEAELGRHTRQQQASREASDALHGVAISRGVAAVHELERREDELLNELVRDPSPHLLEVIGPAPADPTGEQAWRQEVRSAERARVTAEEREIEDSRGTGIEPGEDPREVLASQDLVLLPGYGYAIPREDYEHLQAEAEQLGRDTGYGDGWPDGPDPQIEIDLP